ncbi:MAG: XTP/dITP diphosphatase [Clostridia bacterium]|nr:XTP/dITP diphosphatase [Clostridia bacterium]
MKVLAATGNKGKIREFSQILTPLGFETISPKDIGLDIDPEETGETFAENAKIKAVAFMQASKMPVIADDSGLMVDFLDGAPGVYSARYADGSDADRCKKLLENMKGAENRTARFVSSVCMVFPDGKTIEAEGACEGVITRSPIGENGFGYDPVFYIPSMGKTIAEMSADEKNAISHRGKALRLLAEKLKNE